MNTFYLVNYIFVLVLAVLLGRNGSNRSRITFIVLVSLFIVLEASLRSIDVGSDTPNYVHYFEESFETPWEDLLNQFIMRYFTDENEQDIGFFILAKTVSTFTESFQIYTFVLLCIFFIPLGFFLYKYTSDFLQLTLAYVFFISLFLIFPMTGARQIQAMGPGILAISYIGDRKLWKSLLCVLFGLMLHSSLLLIVPYILLCYFRPSLGKLFHLLSFLFVPIVLMFTNQIILLMADASGMEKYKVYLDSLAIQNPYGIPIGLGNWAGGGQTVSHGTAVCYAHKYFPDIIGKEYAFKTAAWLFGCHPYHNYSLVAVIGATHPKSVFYGNNRADFSFIPGNMAPGILFRKPDHFENYDDWPFLWGQNEGTIAGNTGYLIFGLAFKELIKM